ncbi:MAG: DUF4834 family protein [Bacteroidota bacterium]
MVLLQTILILVLVYYGIKLLLKWLGPRLFSYAVKKTGERFGQQFHNYQSYGGQAMKVGKTTIFKKSSQKPNSSKKVGEYIDFEEID